MAKIERYIPLAWAVVIAIILQGAFIFFDKHDVPNEAAVEFSKAYFQLDRCGMDKHICDALKSKDAVGDYLYAVSSSASARGFDASYLKSRLSNIRTEVVKESDGHAVVALTAKKRQSINPLFETIGVMFGLIKTTEIKQTIDMVKENGEWKVCGDIMQLS